MRIMVLGAAGYLGWPTCMYFARKGHDVLGLDNGYKNAIEYDCNIKQLRPQHSLFREARRQGLRLCQDNLNNLGGIAGDASKPELVDAINDWKPDTIIHYAEQPSAPYSMMGVRECVDGYMNNIATTLNILWAIKDTDIHLVKLGTMGEYGTPEIDIEEGWLDVNHKGRTARLPYPKLPGSFYHASKVADSTNIEFACRAWGIRATDLNQGVVYGAETEETKLHPDLHTSFHYDAIFGTCVNRFIAQACVGQPLTVYGKGDQTRGWLNINDTLKCVELAINHPADPGEFRIFNQFTETLSVNDIATRISKLTGCEIQHIDNPRVEKEKHYYHAENSGLLSLGLDPILMDDEVLSSMIEYVDKYKDNIDLHSLMPKVNWK